MAGRIYLPAEDLERFGVAPAELGGGVSSPRAAALLAFEVARARRLLDEGAPLVGRLRGRGRIAVAGLRRRRPGRARSDRRGRLRRPRGPAAGRPARRARHDAHDAPPTQMSLSEIERAYEHCRRVARNSRSSFYAGMRLLPPERRTALFAVYALARAIDDIADGPLAPAEKLAAARGRVRARLATPGSDPVALAVGGRRRPASRSRSPPSAS